ncbi:MAG TPA: LysM peptidoglycan-binding domain-containing protein [Longimicrobiales bacterium]
MTEAEVRAFLDAERDDRLAAELADRRAADLSAAPVDPADFDIPIEYNDRVRFWMEYFRDRHPDRFADVLARMGRYQEMIAARLRARGMPQDLIFLPLIESGFLPVARSRAGAVGMWQFIAPTARRYGLEVSRYVDERRDPVAATDAALRYLDDLYQRFGDWYLAMAAYNGGENRIERILREHRAEAGTSDSISFWEIGDDLPRETRNYVPKFLAAAILSRYRDRYGFDDVTPEPASAFDTVTVPDATALDVIARAAGTDPGVIERLNPQYIRGVTPPGRAARVRIPAGRAEAFATAYARIPPNRRAHVLDHIVASGETLSGIARRYGTTVAQLREVNHIRDPRTLAIGRRLIIRFDDDAPPPSADTPDHTRTTYRVRRGDTLWDIARRHGVSVDELRAWNDLPASGTIKPGQVLVLHDAVRVIVHRVRPGDTLWDIARQHGTTADAVIEWNGLDEDAVIRPGERLEVPIRQ